MRYICLLRGINVGGNNKVPMTDLKACFESIGSSEVKTYINSGNVIFDHAETDITKLNEQCEMVIEQKFGFHVICAILSAKDVVEAVEHAPKWWGIDDGAKHNAIFVIPPTTAAEVELSVGAAKPEYEKIASYGPIIFWSAPLETFSHTRYGKIVGSSVYKLITIRNANTAKKLVELCK